MVLAGIAVRFLKGVDPLMQALLTSVEATNDMDAVEQTV